MQPAHSREYSPWKIPLMLCLSVPSIWLLLQTICWEVCNITSTRFRRKRIRYEGDYRLGSFSSLQENSMPFMAVALPRITEILTMVSKNHWPLKSFVKQKPLQSAHLKRFCSPFPGNIATWYFGIYVLCIPNAVIAIGNTWMFWSHTRALLDFASLLVSSAIVGSLL